MAETHIETTEHGSRSILSFCGLKTIEDDDLSAV